MEFACSPCVCVGGFLWVLQLPPMSEDMLRLFDNSKLSVGVNTSVTVCLYIVTTRLHSCNKNSETTTVRWKTKVYCQLKAVHNAVKAQTTQNPTHDAGAPQTPAPVSEPSRLERRAVKCSWTTDCRCGSVRCGSVRCGSVRWKPSAPDQEHLVSRGRVVTATSTFILINTNIRRNDSHNIEYCRVIGPKYPQKKMPMEWFLVSLNRSQKW